MKKGRIIEKRVEYQSDSEEDEPSTDIKGDIQQYQILMKREYEYNKMQILRELNFLGAKNKMSYKRRMNNSVKKNLVYQMIYQGFMMVTPFLTVPYLAEVFWWET